MNWLARSVSSYHDASSTRPPHSYIHCAPKTTSHSCGCTIMANVNTFLECARTNTDYSALHCLRAAGASGYPFVQVCITAHSVLYVKGNMLCAAHAWFWPGQLTKGKEKPTGFLFLRDGRSFLSLGLLVSFACMSGLNLRGGVSGVHAQ